MTASSHTVQYLILIGFSSLMVLGADKAFGSGNATRPVAMPVLKSPRRGAVAASFQLQGDRVSMNALGDLSAAEASATRWLSNDSTWMDQAGLRGDEVEQGDAPADGRDIPRTATPLTEVEMVAALREGHRLAFGSLPNESRLGVAWAHIALENSRGREIYCNNFGNVGATDAWTGPYYVRGLRERVQKNPDVWKYFQIKFRAFPSPAEGARAYWKVLDDHYGGALAYFDSGYAFEAARKLTSGGYATALAEPYAMSVARLYQEYRGRVLTQLDPAQ